MCKTPWEPRLGARWTPLRKARLLHLLSIGRLTVDTADRELGVSVEELASWQEAFASKGVKGLKVGALAVGGRQKALAGPLNS